MADTPSGTTPDTPDTPAPTTRAGHPRSARRRSRELALQGLYQWLVGGDDAGVIDAHMREQDEFARCDAEHFGRLLHGCIEQAAAIDAVLARHVDRKTQLLSPVEHAALLIGSFELQHCLEIPYRVVINEGVELAKSFGGTDGHKYVNGVLDKVAGDLRTIEVRAKKNANAQGPNRSSA
jgi:transcription antitermination protein NusB